MCDTCGCNENSNVKIYKPGEDIRPHSHEKNHSHKINLEQDILSANNLLAERNRGYFAGLNIFALNLVSSPGSGKTTLIEETIRVMKNVSIFVIEGDQQTSNDAERILKAGAKTMQINTGNGCHLDAHMVHHALEQLKPESDSMLIIENVGNLVCPSLFDLGEAKRVIIFSVTEGDDKPEKYPTMFHSSDVCILNKTDLLPYVDFDLGKARDSAKRLNPDMVFFELSAKTGNGMQEWIDWLKSCIKS